jgi:hypothetical protein
MNHTVETLVRMLDAAQTEANTATARLASVQADRDYYRDRFLALQNEVDDLRTQASQQDRTLLFARINAGPSSKVIEAYNEGFGGNKIPAIKVYREEAGVLLKEAKEVVDAWVARGALTTTEVDLS